MPGQRCRPPPRSSPPRPRTPSWLFLQEICSHPPASAEVTAFIAGDVMGIQPTGLSRGRTLDRRQGELDHTFALLRQDSFDAQPQRAHGSSPWTEGPRGRPRAPARPPCGSRPRPRRRARPRRRSSSCRGSRPGGRGDLPDRPLLNGRPRTRPGAFGAIPSVIVISFVQRAGQSATARVRELCIANRAIC